MTNPALAPSPVQRLLSLDVLRGITIAFMIMVNNNGGEGSWGFMNHAEWNGLTPTDLVFPTFVFVVGISIVFAFEARLAKGATRAQLAGHTVKRAAILFLLGVFDNGFPRFELAHLRIYGVLQRIAICYLVVGLFYLWDRRVWTKVAALVVALVGYWALLRFVSVPGAGRAFLDPNMNLVAWFDRQLLPGHLWEDGTTHCLRDPEGLLSNLPAFGTTLLGVLAGLWLRTQRTVKAKTLGLAAGAAACLASGYLWSVWFPLNKKMWTSSFVLAAAGWSLVVLTLAYWVVEQWGWGNGRRGKALVWPWLVLGSNAIVAYLFSGLVPSLLWRINFRDGGHKTNPLNWYSAHVLTLIPNRGWAAFAYSLTTLAYCFIPVWVLYRKKIFVKV
jgi:predicted acyltransferase